MQLVAWIASGQFLITNQPGESGIVGVKREADPFVRSEKSLRFLCIFFEEEEYNYSLVHFHRTYIFVIIIPLNSTTRPCS